MNEETQITPNYNENRESSVHGISLRGWLALIIVFTVCLLAGLQVDVKEPLYTIAIMVLSFYFGKEQAKKVNQNEK